MAPRLTAFVPSMLRRVHNGDVDGVLDLPFVHNNATLVTLSPHVAKYVGKRLNRVIDWMLPLKELAPKSPCQATDSSKCLSGFAIQGMMDARRRNYSEIWCVYDLNPHGVNNNLLQGICSQSPHQSCQHTHAHRLSVCTA